VFNVMVSTLPACGDPPQVGRSKPMQNPIDETAQGSEMALVWTLLVAASALVWLIPLLLK
jgi:hypothetical protein